MQRVRPYIYWLCLGLCFSSILSAQETPSRLRFVAPLWQDELAPSAVDQHLRLDLTANHIYAQLMQQAVATGAKLLEHREAELGDAVVYTSHDDTLRFDPTQPELLFGNALGIAQALAYRRVIHHLTQRPIAATWWQSHAASWQVQESHMAATNPLEWTFTVAAQTYLFLDIIEVLARRYALQVAAQLLFWSSNRIPTEHVNGLLLNALLEPRAYRYQLEHLDQSARQLGIMLPHELYAMLANADIEVLLGWQPLAHNAAATLNMARHFIEPHEWNSAMQQFPQAPWRYYLPPSGKNANSQNTDWRHFVAAYEWMLTQATNSPHWMSITTLLQLQSLLLWGNTQDGSLRQIGISSNRSRRELRGIFDMEHLTYNNPDGLHIAVAELQRDNVFASIHISFLRGTDKIGAQLQQIIDWYEQQAAMIQATLTYGTPEYLDAVVTLAVKMQRYLYITHWGLDGHTRATHLVFLGILQSFGLNIATPVSTKINPHDQHVAYLPLNVAVSQAKAWIGASLWQRSLVGELGRLVAQTEQLKVIQDTPEQTQKLLQLVDVVAALLQAYPDPQNRIAFANGLHAEQPQRALKLFWQLHAAHQQHNQAAIEMALQQWQALPTPRGEMRTTPESLRATSLQLAAALDTPVFAASLAELNNPVITRQLQNQLRLLGH